MEDGDALFAVAALAEPVRRSLYAYVRRAGRGVTRDEAAAHAGISRNLAAFHLDKLVAAGLLDAGMGDDAGRRIGRPPKIYRLSELELHVSIPARRYELAAELLLQAIVAGERDDTPPADALMSEARHRGQDFGSMARRRLRRGPVGRERALSLAEDVASEYGFEPVRADRHLVRLRNCPYQRLAKHSRELICAMNGEFFSGVAEGIGGRVQVNVTPWEGHCCVELAT